MNTLMRFLLVGSFFFAIPFGYVHARIVISEIAWMGDSLSANHEWIELLNLSAEIVTLNGWTLEALDGTPTISLSGTLGPGAYGLLKRTNNDTVAPEIPALAIYTGALANTGEHLIVRDESGALVFEINNASGWQAGDATSRHTMQRTESGTFITAPPTPGRATTASTGDGPPPITSPPPTTSPPPNTDPPPSQENDTLQEDIRASSRNVQEERIIAQSNPRDGYQARFTYPKRIVAGYPLTLEYHVEHEKNGPEWRGVFHIAFGDGKAFRHTRPEKIRYTYEEAGTYVMRFEYFYSEFDEDPILVIEEIITVQPFLLEVWYDEILQKVTLINTGASIIPLDHLSVMDRTNRIWIPRGTLLAPQGSFSLLLPELFGSRTHEARMVTALGKVLPFDIPKAQASGDASEIKESIPSPEPAVLSPDDMPAIALTDSDSYTLSEVVSETTLPTLLYGMLFGILGTIGLCIFAFLILQHRNKTENPHEGVWESFEQ
jgi:hypothetical protein